MKESNMTKFFPKMMILFGSLLAVACNSNSNKTYSITYQNDEFIRFNGQSLINHGQTLIVQLVYLSESDFDYSNMKVLVNDKEVVFDGSHFEVPKVKSNLLIKEVGADYKTYSVTYQNSDVVSFSGETAVKRYQNFTFTVNKLDTENYDYVDMKVYANNTEIIPNNDVYTVSNVKSDVVIKAEGITGNIVDVTFASTALFSFSGEPHAKKNSEYTFTITKLSELVSYEGLEVQVNHEIVSAVNGVYHYNVAREDLYIEVTKFTYDDPSKDDDENQGDNPVEDLD